MNVIDCIFFWQGGVITETLEELTLSTIAQLYDELYIPPSSHDFKEILNNLCLGMINFDEFCNSLSEIYKLNINQQVLQDLISKNTTTNHNLIEVAHELRDDYDIWIISDFPSIFLESVFGQIDFKDVFDLNKSIICADAHLTKLIPDLFFHSINTSQHTRENCVLVDSNSDRAVEAVRVGLSSIIYIDVPRLRRELVLREMLRPSRIDYQPHTL